MLKVYCYLHYTLFSHIFRKLNLSPIIKLPHNWHDEGIRITWILISDGEHVPLHLQHSLHCFSIHAFHLVNFFLNFLDHHQRLLLKDELLIEENLPTQMHLSILTYPKLEKATTLLFLPTQNLYNREASLVGRTWQKSFLLNSFHLQK